MCRCRQICLWAYGVSQNATRLADNARGDDANASSAYGFDYMVARRRVGGRSQDVSEFVGVG